MLYRTFKCIVYDILIIIITPVRTNQISALVATKIYIIIDIISTFIVVIGVMIQNNRMHCTHIVYFSSMSLHNINANREVCIIILYIYIPMYTRCTCVEYTIMAYRCACGEMVIIIIIVNNLVR